MKRLNGGMIGGGEGSPIGPAHRLGAPADGNFVLAAGALDVDAEKGRVSMRGEAVATDLYGVEGAAFFRQDCVSHVSNHRISL